MFAFSSLFNRNDNEGVNEIPYSFQQGSTDRISTGKSLSTIRSFILDDQTDAVVSLLKSLAAEKSSRNSQKDGPKSEIGIIVDNAGYELVSDLVLGHCLLATGAADVVTYHTKGHPTFVSDATTKDVLETIEVLKSSPLQATADLGLHYLTFLSLQHYYYYYYFL